jgi:hypothetical protein
MKRTSIVAAVSAAVCLVPVARSFAGPPTPSVATPGSIANAAHEEAYEAGTAQKALPTGAFTKPIEFTIPAAADTSKGETCAVNHAEVPIQLKGVTDGTAPHRFKGDFQVKQDIVVKNFVASLDGPAASKDVYSLKVNFDIDDVKIKSVRPVDISYECVGLDRNFTITLKGIKGSMTFGAPSTKTPKFSYEKTVIKIGSVAVSSDGAAFKKLLNDAIEATIDGMKPSLENNIASLLGAAGGSGVASLLDLGFAGTMGLTGSKTIHDARYLEHGRDAKCTSVPCAIYSIY